MADLARSRTALLLLALPLAAPPVPCQSTVRFDRDVRPLLADRCFACHGRDAEQRKAGLRLDLPDGPDGAYRVRDGRAAIRPGSLADSALWDRVTSADPEFVMPPPRSHEARLDDAERAAIARWIEEGATYQAHWAFVAPVRPALPDVGDGGWCRQPLDRFVLRRLQDGGLGPNPEADRRTLIRRLTLDLTGLPPTRDEIHAFLADRSPDAYERLVDGLLARPTYGEHMARYWLDLVRFADTNGLHHDHYREMSLYRDQVIRSFNENQPYDEFVTDQLAGDLRPDATDAQQIASGFHRLHMIIDVGTALPEESLARNVIDRVTAVGTAFLGLTVQCAVCHDHKYDPIGQADFYAMSAFFNNLDAAPETGARGTTEFKRGLQPPYLEFPTPEQAAALARLETELRAASARVDELKAAVAAAAEDAGRQALDEERKVAEQTLQALRTELTNIQLAVPAAMVMKERAEPRPAYVLIRGDYARPGARVERGTPAFLPPLAATAGTPTRLDFARWLTAPDHPLTARVAVNRFWQQLFGVGLVKTSEDFGAQGEPPSHPELLDLLAVSFVESGWDVKRLLKELVMSAAYRQASAASPERFARDPENRLLARGSRFRMDAEMIRDQILASSGLLVQQLYGRSVKPPQPPGIWAAITLPDSFPRTFAADTGDAIHRRSVYTFWKRALPPPQMTILDAPSREYCTARRERTNTPLQALLLLNEREYLKAARNLAQLALADRNASTEERLEIVYETITGRLPDAVEQDVLLRTARDLHAMYAADPARCAALCEGVTLADGITPAELAAWTMVVSAIYNLDVAKTRG
ncbi:MAG: PSD1 domain-containing protein [Planctomycetes bacterium]|nr:PSD1 domain-containing protein [Planctomycetota bacterium]